MFFACEWQEAGMAAIKLTAVTRNNNTVPGMPESLLFTSTYTSPNKKQNQVRLYCSLQPTQAPTRNKIKSGYTVHFNLHKPQQETKSSQVILFTSTYTSPNKKQNQVRLYCSLQPTQAPTRNKIKSGYTVHFNLHKPQQETKSSQVILFTSTYTSPNKKQNHVRLYSVNVLS